ncbi:hypothetical protein [Nonomuraea insulae]|uniref:Uncharacterized protein n=1 Tax=Nonomuraea insulae TaxID=1616787 RepID=A0ABW1CKR3_9ACTN
MEVALAVARLCASAIGTPVEVGFPVWRGTYGIASFALACHLRRVPWESVVLDRSALALGMLGAGRLLDHPPLWRQVRASLGLSLDHSRFVADGLGLPLCGAHLRFGLADVVVTSAAPGGVIEIGVHSAQPVESPGVDALQVDVVLDDLDATSPIGTGTPA